QQLVSAIAAGDDTPSFADGTFTVQMQLGADKVDAATHAVLDALDRLKREPIDEDRIRRAKTQLKVGRVKSLQTVEEISTSLADDFLSTGDPHFSDRYVDRIDKVTASDLQDVARRYLDRSRLITTLLLPAEAVGSEGLPKAEELIRPAAPTTQAGTKQVASDVKHVELDNNVVLLLKRISTSPLVVMNMYSLGGVTAEDEKTNGLGNLSMQMLSRGTTSRNAEQIAEFFDSVGGELQCVCGNNSWYWTASCLKADFEKTLDAYSDVVNHPSFPQAEFGPMKQRIDAAIDSEDADWTGQAFRYFKQEYFGPRNSPYRFTAVGTKANIDHFTTDQARQWYTQKVLTGRRVLAIYGDIDLQQAESLARKYFGDGAKVTAATPAHEQGAEPANNNSPGISVNVFDVKVQPTQQALAGVVVGFDANPVIGDPVNFPLDVGQTMAGGWGYPTGYLFETLRGKGLVYVVQAQNNPGRSAATPGTFFVFAGCDPSKVNDVVEDILLNIARLQGTPADVNEQWFARSKLLITTADALENETPAQQATTEALDELFGLGYDYHRHFADKINAVTLDQVRQIAAARLRQCMVTICTPDPNAVKINTGPRTYSTFPSVDLTPRGVQHDTGAARP
ncbi:MAG TPA: insulinase family protein, partial [Tepidisphaeraceae bacterium]|nr:insulinase family protein [Tepidisphaeraceae bacterium]